jgi:hypothetical protein
MTVSIHHSGAWRQRPEIGAVYLGPDGEIVTVMATWQAGAVFADEAGCVSAAELVSRYKPRCEICQAFHEPEYPHQLTDAYQRHIQQAHGRAASVADTYTHCTGILRAAVESATREGAVA